MDVDVDVTNAGGVRRLATLLFPAHASHSYQLTALVDALLTVLAMLTL